MLVGLLHCFLYPLYCQLDMIFTAASKEYGHIYTAEAPVAVISLSLWTSQEVLRWDCKP